MTAPFVFKAFLPLRSAQGNRGSRVARQKVAISLDISAVNPLLRMGRSSHPYGALIIMHYRTVTKLAITALGVAASSLAFAQASTSATTTTPTDSWRCLTERLRGHAGSAWVNPSSRTPRFTFACDDKDQAFAFAAADSITRSGWSRLFNMADSTAAAAGPMATASMSRLWRDPIGAIRDFGKLGLISRTRKWGQSVSRRTGPRQGARLWTPLGIAARSASRLKAVRADLAGAHADAWRQRGLDTIMLGVQSPSAEA